MSRVRGELGRFLVVGSTTVAIDFVSYRLLLWTGLAIALSKAAGFIIGTLFAYFANRHWTFAAAGGCRRFVAFLGLYGLGLVVNVSVNSGVLGLLGLSEPALAVAFVVATGASATWNFLGMKFLIFNPALGAGGGRG